MATSSGTRWPAFVTGSSFTSTSPGQDEAARLSPRFTKTTCHEQVVEPLLHVLSSDSVDHLEILSSASGGRS